MRKLLTILSAVILITACSDNDLIDTDDVKETPQQNGPDKEEEEDEDQNNGINDAAKLNLSRNNKRTANIFELMEFGVVPDKNCTLLDLRQYYDSIVFSISGIKGTFPIITRHGNSFTWKWSHTFFAPGEYEVTLNSYTGKEVIYSDTLTVTILNEKDFLNYNWIDITEPSKSNSGYNDLFSDKIYPATYERLNEGIPSVTFFLSGSYDEEDYFAIKEKDLLYCYIEGIYSKPDYTADEKTDLLDIYSSLFANPPVDADPLFIWLTGRSKLALLGKYNKEIDYYSHEVYAEPNR